MGLKTTDNYNRYKLSDLTIGQPSRNRRQTYLVVSARENVKPLPEQQIAVLGRRAPLVEHLHVGHLRPAGVRLLGAHEARRVAGVGVDVLVHGRK